MSYFAMNQIQNAFMKADLSQRGLLFQGLSALHQAVLDNNLAVVRILIGHGSDINLQDDDSWTPLHAACANGNSEIAK